MRDFIYIYGECLRVAVLGQIVPAFAILIAVAKLSSKGVGSQLGSH